MPTLRRQPSRRTAATRIQRSFRRRRAVPRKSWFNTKPARPELKRIQYSEDAETITATALNFNKYLAGHQVDQGLGDDQRVGNRISAKYLQVKMLLENTNDAKAMMLRYCIWSPKSTTQDLSMTGLSSINRKLFKIIRTGYISVNHDSARVKTLNIPMYNKVIEYPSNDVDTPVNQDRLYITLVCVTTGMTLRYSSNVNLWYTDA